MWFSTFTNLKSLIEFLAERTLNITFDDKLLSGVWHIIWVELKELDEIVITNTFHFHLFTTMNKFSQQLPLLSRGTRTKSMQKSVLL